MAIRKIPFILCLVASLLIVNLAANAAFLGTGDIPNPPGHGDHPDPPGHGDNPNPPGPGDHPTPPDQGDHPNPPGHGDNPNPPGHDGNPGPLFADSLPLLANADGDHRPGYDGLSNAFGNLDPENQNQQRARLVLAHLLSENGGPPSKVGQYLDPPGNNHNPGPPELTSDSFDLQSLGYQGTTYTVNPEPATLGLILLGGAVALLRRKP